MLQIVSRRKLITRRVEGKPGLCGGFMVASGGFAEGCHQIGCLSATSYQRGVIGRGEGLERLLRSFKAFGLCN
jgi:hypothetical protein